jgi:hypothetical protein
MTPQKMQKYKKLIKVKYTSLADEKISFNFHDITMSAVCFPRAFNILIGYVAAGFRLQI